jgi:ubiquinol-cytochrome c reductase cytochrome b subunit
MSPNRPVRADTPPQAAPETGPVEASAGRGRVADAVDARLGHRAALRAVLAYPVRGGASWGHALGVVLVALFLVECLTGAILAAYYSPSVTDAWASVAYIETRVAGGRVVRGLHHFTTGAMVIVAGLHAAHVVLRGAYKAPREPNWWVGLALLALVLAYPLTGYTLLWDQLGYWASKVRTGILGTVPLVGGFLKDLAIGGNDHGNLTLTRTYALHVLVLPALTFGLIVLHVALFRRSGYTPPPGREAAEPYRARQAAYDLTLSAVTLGAVLALAAAFGAPLEAPADPTANYLARPEWYFLPLFQLLKYFDGPLQVVGTVVIPGAVAAFLLALPLLDRSPDRRIRPRLRWIGGVFGLLAAGAVLAGLAKAEDLGDPRFEDHRRFAAREAARALVLAEEGVPPEGAAFMMSRDALVRGERVFRERCRSCHALEGFVPEEPLGPDLTAYGSKAWLRQLLRDPDSPRFFGRAEKVEGMPSFADLSEDELGILTDMLVSLRAHDGVDIEAHPHYDDLIFEAECDGCHDFADMWGVEGPALAGYLSPSWIRAMIDHPGDPDLYGQMNEMPAFEAKLDDADKTALVRFLQSLEARADRDAWPYVDEPLSSPGERPEKETPEDAQAEPRSEDDPAEVSE